MQILPLNFLIHRAKFLKINLYDPNTKCKFKKRNLLKIKGRTIP